ncbi:hypothetical protein KI387_004167, partial [Taxus chinensis]
SIRELAMVLQGNIAGTNQGPSNNGEGSSTGPVRASSKPTPHIFIAKFLQREEPIEEVAQNDVDDVEAYGDEYMQLSLRVRDMLPFRDFFQLNNNKGVGRSRRAHQETPRRDIHQRLDK